MDRRERKTNRFCSPPSIASAPATTAAAVVLLAGWPELIQLIRRRGAGLKFTLHYSTLSYYFTSFHSAPSASSTQLDSTRVYCTTTTTNTTTAATTLLCAFASPSTQGLIAFSNQHFNKTYKHQQPLAGQVCRQFCKINEHNYYEHNQFLLIPFLTWTLITFILSIKPA